MSGQQAFPLLDELAFEQALGSWQGVRNEVAQWFGEACTNVHANLDTWHGRSRVEFMQWWWGGDGRTESLQGAKGDVGILLEIIDHIISALSAYRAAVDGINGWLARANTLIAANTNQGEFTLHNHEQGMKANFYIVKGTMHTQGLGSTVPYDCYLELSPTPIPFPYTPEGGWKAPDWWPEANRYAGNAVEEFNAACQTAINHLSDVTALAGQVHWLKPYTSSAGFSGLTITDPVWRLLSGGMQTRPFDFPAKDVLGKVTYKDGKATLHWSGDPFAPSNVPKWYTHSSLLDTVEHAFEKYGLAGLSVLLVAAGQPEGAAIIDTVVDSAAFESAFFDALAGGSIAGVLVSGADLVVDSGAVKSIAEALAEQMLGGKNSELFAEFGDQLEGVITERILDAPEKDGHYEIDTSTLTTPTGVQNRDAYGAGYRAVENPVIAHTRGR